MSLMTRIKRRLEGRTDRTDCTNGAFPRVVEVSAPCLPFGAVRVTDEGRMSAQSVEVLVNGEPACRLPAVSTDYKMTIHGESVLMIGLHVNEPVVIEGGEPQNLIRKARKQLMNGKTTPNAVRASFGLDQS